MKYEVLKLLTKRNFDIEKFVESIKEHRNTILVLNKDYDLKILATAAPSVYANLIREKEGFDKCLGTDLPPKFKEDFENLGENKKRNVLKYLSSLGLNNVDVFITDHLDDLPLMKCSLKNLLIRPNEQTISVLNKNNISYEIIN